MCLCSMMLYSFVFFNDTATTEIYTDCHTLSLHDALPIFSLGVGFASVAFALVLGVGLGLLSGYLGGTVDAIIMRIADVQLTFPAILIALLIEIGRAHV